VYCIVFVLTALWRMMIDSGGGGGENDNGKWYNYVCITINQPDTKSNPYLNSMG